MAEYHKHGKSKASTTTDNRNHLSIALQLLKEAYYKPICFRVLMDLDMDKSVLYRIVLTVKLWMRPVKK